MQDGDKVKINDNTFVGCLSHLNGQVGIIQGAGVISGNHGVNLSTGGRCFVAKENLTKIN